MTRSPKSKEKHYRLTHAEWLHIIHELKESEKDLLYYLRTLDPFGDRPLNLGVREIARTLQCNPSTISRALKRLDELGYIDMEMVTVRVKVLSKHHTDTESEEVLRPSNSVASEQQVGSQRNKLDRDATSWIVTQQVGSQRNTCPLDPLQPVDSRSPHTIQTLNTIHTLSNSAGGSDFSEVDQQEEGQRKCLESVGQIISSQVQQGTIPTDPIKDKSSAPPPKIVENNNLPLDFEHPTVQMDNQFLKSANIPAWRTSRGPNSFKPEFVEWIRKWLSSIPPARDRSKGDAIAYLLKQERGGNLDVLEARAEEWLQSLEKLANSQRQQQQIVNQAVAPVAVVDVPDDQEERLANFQKINQIIQSIRHKGGSSAVNSRPTPPVTSKPPKPLDCEVDFSDLLTRLSLHKMRLGWAAEKFQGWFIKQYGVTSDRLQDGQLLDAVETFEALTA